MADSTLEKSFIPKSSAGKGKLSSASSLGNIIGWGVFGIILILALGVFLYGQYVESLNAEIEEKISESAKNIDKEVLEELRAFDSRLNAVQGILSGHIASSKLLDLVGETTIKNIQFDTLEFDMNGGSVPTISISGTAPNFRSVAAQIGILNANEKFVKALVSELSVSEAESGGKIIFTIDAQVDPKVVDYNVESGEVLELPTDMDEEDEDGLGEGTATTTLDVDEDNVKEE